MANGLAGAIRSRGTSVDYFPHIGLKTRKSR